VERVKKIFNLQSSIFNPKINLPDALLIIWLLLIPTQLGRHFWLKESSVIGIRIDYLSIILYLTDVLWLGWVVSQSSIFSLQSSIFNLQSSIFPLKADQPLVEMKRGFKKIFSFQNLILVLLVGVNIILARARWVALYRWLRIGQWGLTIKLVSKNKKEIRNYLVKVIPWWIVIEAFLGLAQIVKGGSLNGFWWWLGERKFTYGGIGIAQFRIFDYAWIRAYGTFSHPNSLAGFLLLAWWWWRSNLPPTPFFDKTGVKNFLLKRVFYWIVNWSAVMGIFLSGSRVVWVVTAGMLIGEEILKSRKIKGKGTIATVPYNPYNSHNPYNSYKLLIAKLLLGIGVVLIIMGVISVNYRISDFVGGWDINSLEKRKALALSAIKMIKESPLFGIGAGNFVVNLPKYQSGNFYWLQPVHNILLLAWSEIGILGIIILVFSLLFSFTKITKKKYWWIWIIVGITGFFDHYWLTLPQNSWLLAIILGLI